MLKISDSAIKDMMQTLAEEYTVLVENNNHEGETWRFYIPLENNKEAIEWIEEYINSAESENYYYFEDPVLHPAQIRRMPEGGYMSPYNLLFGTINLKALKKAAKSGDDPLYKGGLNQYGLTFVV